MRKPLLLFAAFFFLPGLLLAQDGMPLALKSKKEIPILPSKDGAIYYEEVVELGPTITKDGLYWAAMEWFGNNYPVAKVALQVDDKAEGKLMGKGMMHKYGVEQGHNYTTVYFSFALDIDIKDGRYRYRIYDFKSIDRLWPYHNFNLLNRLGNQSDSWKGKEALEDKEYTIQVLTGLDRQVQIIAESLKSALDKQSDL